MASTKTKAAWQKKPGMPNEILKGTGFFISFNPGNHAFPGWEADDKGSETAIVKGNEFFILNGDFRKQYEKLAPKGFAACKKFFDSKPELRSSWSN